MQELSKHNITYIQGVGPKKADVLHKEIEVASWEDMLYYFPYKYIDRSKIFKIREIDGNMPYIQLKGKIIRYEALGEGRSRRLTAKFQDETGSVELVWFRSIKSIPNIYKINTEYILFGKPSLFNGKINIAHPELDSQDHFFKGEVGVQGQYHTTERMKNAFLHSRAIQKIISQILENLPAPLSETLPERIVQEKGFLSLETAIRNVHFPTSADLLRKARYRLKWEELFYLQLNILRSTKYRQKKLKGFLFEKVGEYFNAFYKECLPFSLTNAQKKVLKEIRFDVNSGRQMNRLLQGDVGSGKTIVALFSMLLALDNGFQAAIMAPTEILATQHYESFSELLKPLGIDVVLLTGSTKKKDREKIFPQLKDGTTKIVIGTHALLEDPVVFSNLGLVVIDEQHRFGVMQRARLWKKNTRPPHVLVMTATPIPRTLAMTVYGDLDVSIIDELPPGRKPIKTLHMYSEKRKNLYDSVRKQLQEGRQVYIVYPLIEESEAIDLQNLTEGFQTTQEIFPEYRVSMVHGKMKPADKDEAMRKFLARETQIMVATTVIEVGVNVPNASVMIIENAERFGLSQLHQLRGRVGRGADQSFCILITKYELSEDTRRRISVMTETNDGFVIAEEDLKLRGPGNIDGTQQSGIPFNLKIANLLQDTQLLATARETAQEVLETDPEFTRPEHEVLKAQLLKLNKKTNQSWFMIS